MSGGDKVKGSSHRVITTPGYHIKPQFDLVHTRHLISEKRNKKKSFQLMLAPMVDMFSILVIYLIMNFSTEGEIFFINRDVSIPKSSSGQAMQSYPLITVLGTNIMFDSIESRSPVTEVNDEKVPRLRAALAEVKKFETNLGGETAFKGQINLQADEKTPIEEVKKVMRVLIEEGWTRINFIVTPEKS